MQLFTSPPRRNLAPVMVPDDVPVYRIGEGKFYCDDELHEAGTIIAYEEEPNESMIPLNALGMEHMRAFLAKLDGFGKKKCTAEKTAFISKLEHFDSQQALMKSGKRGRRLDAPDEAPSLGMKRYGAPKVSRIEMQEVQEPVIIQAGRKTPEGVDESGEPA